MPGELFFRAAQPRDWDSVAALLADAQLPLDGAEAHLADFILAVDGDRLVGAVGWERYGDHALLRSLVVAPELRGQRVGIALVNALLARARAEQLATLVLLTETAVDFFRRFGFRPMERGAAPAPVTASAEFQGACPLSATVMQLDLT